MRNYLGLDSTRSMVEPETVLNYSEELNIIQEKLWSGKEEFTGWVKLPIEIDREKINQIKETAKKIQNQCDAFVVIGIGGSYLGAKAAIQMLTNIFGTCEKDNEKLPKVYFAGQNLSGTYHRELLEELKEKEVCICVISKSGTTTEPCIAFTLLKTLLQDKYGIEEAKNRIYVITDQFTGTLRKEVEREGYDSFIVPADVAGRYSVLSPVGLLPIAVAGLDIEEMLEGAAFCAKKINSLESKSENKIVESAWQYAVIRKTLFDRGKVIEVFEYYEPKLQYFSEWLKQLFGESEGKDGKGLFPVALQFTTDLHSMGQFLQEGNPIFFETVLNVLESEKDFIISEDAGKIFAGKSMNAVNQAAVSGVMAAHERAGVSILEINIPALTPYYFGQLVYFFETSCAMSGYLIGVNPFNQPGVEKYKEELNACLHKGDL